MRRERTLGLLAGLMLLAGGTSAPRVFSADPTGKRSARKAYEESRQVQAKTKRLRARVEALEAQIKQKNAELANYRRVKAGNARIIAKLETGK
ncbi:MAG: hypothetical protein GXP31_09750 [Kiritimatiellaeota bacterium]|nr:hypothetical protein [Kiritimatiellota bacterium]